jgi:hypothetical protein
MEYYYIVQVDTFSMYTWCEYMSVSCDCGLTITFIVLLYMYISVLVVSETCVEYMKHCILDNHNYIYGITCLLKTIGLHTRYVYTVHIVKHLHIKSIMMLLNHVRLMFSEPFLQNNNFHKATFLTIGNRPYRLVQIVHQKWSHVK